ncbi:MAG: HK97 family phage prohead protease [Henriciella sp.]|nr:HK97 family phage prohead protease [Henriciella sp.]
MSAQPTPHAARASVLLIEGYASLFGVTDQTGDQVRAGAFSEALTRADIPMLLQHILPATDIFVDGRLESTWLNSAQWNVPLYWQIGANDPILFIHSVE